MDIYNLYELISSNIDSYCKFIQTSNEIVLRCPYCGDSVKHLNKGHFYIGENFGAFLYNCKRSECGATGVLNKRVLEDIGIFDLNLFSELTKRNNSLEYKKKISNTVSNNNLFDRYDFNYYKSKYPHKMNYLSKRLYNIDDIDLNEYRIIVSPKSFIETFKIKLNKFQEKLLNDLEYNAVAFLNMNGSNIVFRYVSNNFKYRYFKLSLNDDVDIYSIRNEVDLYKSNKLIINMCEGAFDCINIKNRLKPDASDELFFAVNGADYVNKVEYISKLTGLINIELNIYRDTDKPVNLILNQFKHSIFYNNLNIYSNTRAKDYSEDELKIIKDY